MKLNEKEKLNQHKQAKKMRLEHKIKHINKIKNMMQSRIDKCQVELDELNKEE